MSDDDQKFAKANVIDTMMANVDNDKLSDTEFRQLFRNSVARFRPVGQRHMPNDNVGPYGSGVGQDER